MFRNCWVILAPQEVAQSCYFYCKTLIDVGRSRVNTVLQQKRKCTTTKKLCQNIYYTCEAFTSEFKNFTGLVT